MKGRKKLRAPFVATFAVAAGACGGQVSHVDNGSPGSSSNPPAQVFDAGSGCPTDWPQINSPCNVPAETKCTSGYCGTFFTCQEGVWHETAMDCACPIDEPTTGAACHFPPQMTCTYHQDACDPAHNYQSPISYACTTDDLWKVVGGGSCNPPPPTCPTAPPQNGDPCYGGLKCDYGDCLGSPTTLATCTGTKWEVMVSSCNPPFVDGGGGE